MDDPNEIPRVDVVALVLARLDDVDFTDDPKAELSYIERAETFIRWLSTEGWKIEQRTWLDGYTGTHR